MIKIDFRKFIQVAFVAAFFALSFFVPLSTPLYGQVSNAGLTPFGGKIIVSNFCTCSGSWGIKVGPPVSGDFIYQVGASQLFREYQIFHPGPWVVGIASGYAPCMQVRGNSCVNDEQVPGGPVIMMVGTSL